MHKGENFKEGILRYDKENLYIQNGNGMIMLDNIIKVEKRGNIFTNEMIRIRNYSEYMIITVPIAYHTTKKGNQIVLVSHKNTKEVYTLCQQYSHGVKNPMYW